jgi:hypothetical protein
MKNLKYIYLLVFAILSCTRFEDPTIGLSNKVELTTSKVTVISSDTALFEGNILKDGNEGISERGFAYHTAAKPKITNKTVKTGLGIGIFSGRATDLLPNTQYFVAAYAINKSGSVYGADLSFNTPKSAPRLSTAIIASFTPYSAIISSSITLDGGSPVTERGVCYNTSPGASIQNNKVVSPSTTNAYNTTLTNLNPGATYYVRSYAINGVGVGYGQEITLKTADIKLPTVDPTCLPATSITYSDATVSANITNDGLSNKLETGIILSTSSNPTDLTFNNANSQTVKSTLTTAGKITMVLSNLKVGTKYFYVSYAKNEAGISYSPVCTFTTVDFTGPTLAQNCIAASNIGVNVATITGDVVSDGGIATLEKGFIFNTSNTNLDYRNSGSLTFKSSETVKGIYSYVITDLKPKTKYFYRAYSINTKGTSYGPICDFTTIDYTAPQVNTTCIDPDLTLGTAKIYGFVLEDGGDANLEKGFVYGTSSTLTYTKGSSNTLVSSGKGKGAFSFVISNLALGTTYFYKTYAINATGNLVYGPLCQFTTLADRPIIGANCITPSSINFTDATLLGNLESWGSDNSSNSRERGAIWSTSLSNISATTPIGTSTISTWGGSGLGQFQVYLPTLSSGTTYYYRIYAKTIFGTSYGQVCTFNTRATVLPTLSQTCTSATNLQTTSARVSANVIDDGGNYSVSGFLYSTATSNLVVTNGNTPRALVAISSNSLSANLTGLTGGTLYYYRAFITGPGGTGYGPVCSFTTITPPIPTLSQTCISATNLQSTSARVSANVTNDGGSVSASGFLYSTSSSTSNLVVTNTNTLRASASISSNSMSVNLTGLTGATLYYYRAYITGPGGTGYGPVCSFTTTTPSVVIPTVVSNSATGIVRATSTVEGRATINGEVLANGGGTISAIGFEWSTSSSFSPKSTGNATAVSGASFSITLTTPSNNFIVYYRAYATNSAGTGYGVIRQFTFP